jgi:hypothetical protein
MDVDGGVDKQPNPEPMALGKCTFILFFLSCQAILLECLPNDYQMIICKVLIVVWFD